MTFQEMLKAQGLTDEQIKVIMADQKLASTFESMVTKAEADKTEAARLKTEAEQKDRKLREFWDKEATPKINEAYSQVASAQATADFYKRQAEEAKKLGFIAADAPGFDPKRGPDGKFTKEGEVPGSPGLTKEELANTEKRTIDAFFAAQELSNEHLALFGAPLTNLTQHVKDATAAGKPLRAYVEEKFGFQKKREELVAAKQKEHDDAIRKEERAAATKEFQEKYGSNPDTRTPVVSQFSKYKKTESGGMDRLAWRKADKRQIHDQLKQEALKELVH